MGGDRYDDWCVGKQQFQRDKRSRMLGLAFGVRSSHPTWLWVLPCCQLVGQAYDFRNGRFMVCRALLVLLYAAASHRLCLSKQQPNSSNLSPKPKRFPLLLQYVYSHNSDASAIGFSYVRCATFPPQDSLTTTTAALPYIEHDTPRGLNPAFSTRWQTNISSASPPAPPTTPPRTKPSSSILPPQRL